MLAWALWTLTAVGVTCVAALDGDDEVCKEHSNGCSVPFWLALFMRCKEHFRKACDRHDTCYHCGATFGITREQCDDAFHDDMLQLCKDSVVADQCTDRRRREASSSSSSSSSRAFRPARSLMDNKPTGDSQQGNAGVKTCVEWAGDYHRGVQSFGLSSYNNETRTDCGAKFSQCLPQV